jgi:hypothetical protein
MVTNRTSFTLLTCYNLSSVELDGVGVQELNEPDLVSKLRREVAMSEMKVFLSYVADTKPFVDEFSQHFFSHELELQHLRRDVEAGKLEREELDKRIDIADIFIAVIGSTYEKDCSHELERRANLRKAGQFPSIVPITLSRPARSGGTISNGAWGSR